MSVLLGRRVAVFYLCLLAAACSTTPTSPSTTGNGPAMSHGILTGLIPQSPPPVPPRLTVPPTSALGATRFVAFGDSITYGTLSSYDGAFVYDAPTHSYPARLQLALDYYHAGGEPRRTYSVVNSGKPVETAENGLRRIQSVITEHRPQGLLLLEGINDLAGLEGSPSFIVAQTISSLSRIIDVARTNNVTVLVATMPQTYETTNPETGQYRDNARDLIVPFNTEVRKFALRQNVYVVDLYASFGTNRAYIGGDGLHPTLAGYDRMASTFLAVVESVFTIKGSFQ